MGKFWKEILAPGRYRLKDGRVVEYTQADCENAQKRGRGMLKAGLRIPLCWEHDPRAEPAYLSDLHANAWLARGYFGDVQDYRVTPDGRLEALVTIHTPEDEKQFLRVGTVSPRVDFDWTDEKGKTWTGLTVGHIAATPRPVQRHQSRNVCRASSDLSNNVPSGRSRETHYLSQATRVEPNMPMPDIEPEPDGDATAPGDGGAGAKVQKIAALLSEHCGLHLGSPATWDDLAIAVEAACRTMSGKPEDEPEPEENDTGDEDEYPETATEDEDPTAGKTAQAQMPPAMMSLFANAAKTLGETTGMRIDKLAATGRIDGETARKMHVELKRANLSASNFDKEGNFKGIPLMAKIEAFESLPPGRFAKPGKKGRTVDLSHTEPVHAPSKFTAGGSTGVNGAPPGVSPEEHAAVLSFYKQRSAEVSVVAPNK